MNKKVKSITKKQEKKKQNKRSEKINSNILKCLLNTRKNIH